jgi:hypothetical protein
MAGLLDDPNAPPQTASLPPSASPSPDDMGSEAGGLPGLLAAPPPASAGPTGRPEYFPFDPSKMTGTDYLNQMLPHAAAAALPPGYTAEMMPHGGYRPGSTVAVSGEPSMHASSGALDVNIRRPDGSIVPNAPGDLDTTGHYGNLALAIRGMTDPSMVHWLRWGDAFKNPYRDIQHYDWAGEGPNGPLEQLARTRGGQVAQAAPTVPNVTGRPP